MRLKLDEACSRLRENDPELQEELHLEIQIGDDGAKALADALKSNTTLKVLWLSYNQIGHDGAKALAVALQSNTTLQLLDLSNNQIGDDGAKALADALKSNTTLKVLSLFCNRIGDDCAKALLQMLEKHNGTLSRLSLGGNSISDSLHQKIDALVKANEYNSRNPPPQPLPTSRALPERQRREQEATVQRRSEEEEADTKDGTEVMSPLLEIDNECVVPKEFAWMDAEEYRAAVIAQRQVDEGKQNRGTDSPVSSRVILGSKQEAGVQLHGGKAEVAAMHARHGDEQYQLSIEDVQLLQEIKKCGLLTPEQLDALQKLTANIDDFDKSLESVRGLPDELKGMPEYVQLYFTSFCQAFQRTYLASEVLSTGAVQGKLTGKNNALFASILGIVGKGLTKSGVPFLACSSILITLYTHQLQTKQNNSLWVFQDFFNGDSRDEYMLTYRYAAKAICKMDHFSELTHGTCMNNLLIRKINTLMLKPLQEVVTGNLKKVHMLRFEEMEPVGLKVIDDLHTIACGVLELWEQDQDKYNYFSGADVQTKAVFVLECLGIVASGSSYEQNFCLSKAQACPSEEIGTAKPHVKENNAVLNEPATRSEFEELRTHFIHQGKNIKQLMVDNERKGKKIERLEKHIHADDDQDVDVHVGGGQKQTLLSKNARKTANAVDVEFRERKLSVESDRRMDSLYQHLENVTSTVEDLRYRLFLVDRPLSRPEAEQLIEKILWRSSNDCSGGRGKQHQRNPTVPPHEAVFSDEQGCFVINDRRLRIGTYQGKKLWKKHHKIKISQDHLKVKSIKYWFEVNGLEYRYELHCKAVVMDMFSDEIMALGAPVENTPCFQQQRSADEDADEEAGADDDAGADEEAERDYLLDPDGKWLA